jgi:hypothetical protein
MKAYKGLCRLLPLGAVATLLFAIDASAGAEMMSEIDAFQRAVSSQNKQDALAFIDSFGSSHLVPDLIELLRPDVAADLCLGLSSHSPRVRATCDRVAKTVANVAVAPTVPSPLNTATPTSGEMELLARKE